LAFFWRLDRSAVAGGVCRPARILHFNDVPPAVGLGAVEVGEAVLAREAAGRERTAVATVELRVGVPSVISTASPPGSRISSGSAKWLVIKCVSIARRRIRSPFSRSCSHTGVSHSNSSSPPQMSLTRTSSPLSASIRCTSASTCAGSRWSTSTAIPLPPAAVTRSAGGRTPNFAPWSFGRCNRRWRRPRRARLPCPVRRRGSRPPRVPPSR
jgi:hypothetical protein